MASESSAVASARMARTVSWQDDGTPLSASFNDIYRSTGADGRGGLAQARHVFLQGCGLLPTDHDDSPLWRQAERWAILELGFGLGLNFLASWHAWRADPARPRRLFYSAVEGFPVEPDDLLRSAAPFPELAELAQALAARWHDLLPGIHRLSFEEGRLQLTLAVGDVRIALQQLTGAYDSIYLDGFNPARNPDMWSARTLKSVARLARRGTRAATWCVAGTVRKNLQQCGFEVQRVPGLPPKRQALQARYDPAWPIRHSLRRAEPVVCEHTARCLVIGAGIAGASAAWSLAQRGWQVTVLDAGHRPCSGASGVPVGLVAPHVSPDDCPLSQLTRAGVQATLERARALLTEGQDFSASGLLERHAPGRRRLPPQWRQWQHSPAMRASSLSAPHRTTQAQAAAAGVPMDARQTALWHGQAGWLQPAALVAAMLAATNVQWRADCTVTTLRPQARAWLLLDDHGQEIDRAELVVMAAGFESLHLLGPDAVLPLHALRGQVTTGPMPVLDSGAVWPGFPVSGQGHFVANIPTPQGLRWQTGSTFERDSTDVRASAQGAQANRQTLAALLPDIAALVAPQWRQGQTQGWAGVRATLPDHLPAVGSWLPGRTPRPPELLPLQLCAGFGARGLTLAVLCGELLAAQLHGEPLPVSRKLAWQLRPGRFDRGGPQ